MSDTHPQTDPLLGQTVPDIQLRDQDGHIVSLPDFRGQKVVLFFYPKADTPG